MSENSGHKLLIRALFNDAFRDQLAKRNSCRELKKACGLSRAAARECHSTNLSDEYFGVLSSCDVFVQVIHTTRSPNFSTNVWYKPLDTNLFAQEHSNKVLIQDIGSEVYLPIDGSSLLDPFEEDTVFEEQSALYGYFRDSSGRLNQLPKGGGKIFCYVHLFD